MRLSRPCYDKYRRCPGWAGGGLKYAKNLTCHNGSIIIPDDETHWKWRFHSCNSCDVVVFPYVIRWTSPRWLRTWLGFKVSDIKFKIDDRLHFRE